MAVPPPPAPVASAMPEWLVGVLLCALGSTFTALGLVIQKYSHERNARAANPRIFLRQPWWIFGLAMYLSSQVLNLVAMGMAPQVVLSSLGAWSLVCNAIFACMLLGERLRWKEVVSMFGAVGGVVLVIQATPAPGQAMHGDLEAMGNSFTSPAFLWTTSTLVAVDLLFLGVTHFCKRKRHVAWALTSALLSGYSVMLFKCVALLLIDPVNDEYDQSPWADRQSYAIVVGAAIVGVSQLHSLNAGLKMGQALVVVPIYYTLGMLAQIMTGAIFFNELADFSDAFQVTRFWGGAIFLLLCIFFLTQSQSPNKPELDLESQVFAEESSVRSQRKSPRTPPWSFSKLRIGIFSDDAPSSAATPSAPSTPFGPIAVQTFEFEASERGKDRTPSQNLRLTPFDLFRVLDVSSSGIGFYSYWLDPRTKCVCAAGLLEGRMSYNRGKTFASQFVVRPDGAAMLRDEIVRRFRIDNDRVVRSHSFRSFGRLSATSPTASAASPTRLAFAQSGDLPGNPAAVDDDTDEDADHGDLGEVSPQVTHMPTMKVPLLVCVTGDNRQALCDDAEGRHKLDAFLHEVNKLIGRYGLVCLFYCPAEIDEASYELCAVDWMVQHGDLDVSSVKLSQAYSRFRNLQQDVPVTLGEVLAELGDLHAEGLLTAAFRSAGGRGLAERTPPASPGQRSRSQRSVGGEFAGSVREAEVLAADGDMLDTLPPSVPAASFCRALEQSPPLLRALLHTRLFAGTLTVGPTTTQVMLCQADHLEASQVHAVNLGHRTPLVAPDAAGGCQAALLAKQAPRTRRKARELLFDTGKDPRPAWSEEGPVDSKRHQLWKELVEACLEERCVPAERRGFFVGAGAVFEAAGEAGCVGRILERDDFLRRVVLRRDALLDGKARDRENVGAVIAALTLVACLVEHTLHRTALIVCKHKWRIAGNGGPPESAELVATWTLGLYLKHSGVMGVPLHL